LSTICQNRLWQIWMLWQETYNTFHIFHFVTLWSNWTNQNFQRLFHFSTVTINRTLFNYKMITKTINLSIWIRYWIHPWHYFTIFQNDHWNRKILIIQFQIYPQYYQLNDISSPTNINVGTNLVKLLHVSDHFEISITWGTKFI
jgi:hypothetical protein